MKAEETKSAHRVKLKEASSGLECGLLGLQKKSRRLIFLLEKKVIETGIEAKEWIDRLSDRKIIEGERDY